MQNYSLEYYHPDGLPNKAVDYYVSHPIWRNEHLNLSENNHANKSKNTHKNV